MSALRRDDSKDGAMRLGWRRGESGQATLEFALVGTLMLILVMGVIDFGRLIYQQQVITHLSREGSDVAARGSTVANAANAVVTGSSSLNLGTNGLVIVTAVQNIAGANKVTAQASQGGISGSSKIGQVGGNATIPQTNPQIPQLNQTVYVTEVYYAYAPITPIGQLISGLVLPTKLYDVAYF